MYKHFAFFSRYIMRTAITTENSFEKKPYLQMIVFLPPLPGTMNQVFKECNGNPVLQNGNQK